MVKQSKSRILTKQSEQKDEPTYEDLNAFMRPSVLSQKYEYPNLHIYPDSPDYPDSHNSSSGSDSEPADECNVSYKTNGSYATSTSGKDLKLYDMKCLLDKKRRDIYDKNREVKELATKNPYLSSIVSDYENIGSTILEEKKDQKSALNILSKHIRDISEHMKHDEFQLHRIREDQQILMDEIDKLRKDIGYINNKIARDSSKKKEPRYPNWRYDDDYDYDDEDEDDDDDDDDDEGEYEYEDDEEGNDDENEDEYEDDEEGNDDENEDEGEDEEDAIFSSDYDYVDSINR
jgi:hypothetical protein